MQSYLVKSSDNDTNAVSLLRFRPNLFSSSIDIENSLLIVINIDQFDEFYPVKSKFSDFLPTNSVMTLSTSFFWVSNLFMFRYLYCHFEFIIILSLTYLHSIARTVKFLLFSPMCANSSRNVSFHLKVCSMYNAFKN